MREGFLNDVFEYGDGLYTTSACLVPFHPFLTLLCENNPTIGGDPVRIVRCIHSRRIQFRYVDLVDLLFAFARTAEGVTHSNIAQIRSGLQSQSQSKLALFITVLHESSAR